MAQCWRRPQAQNESDPEGKSRQAFSTRSYAQGAGRLYIWNMVKSNTNAFLLFAVILVAALFVPLQGAAAQAAAQGGGQPGALPGTQAAGGAAVPYIRVSGQASLKVEADTAVLSLAVSQQAKTASALRASTASAADAVARALISLGVDKKEIRTGNFSIYPVYETRQGKQNEISGYRSDLVLTVTLEDIALVPQAVEAAFAAGANEIRSLNYQKKDEEALRISTLVKALEAARAKAYAMASALGRELGPALSIEEQGFSARVPETRMYMAKAADMGGGGEGYSPGSIELSAEVSVVFELR